MKAVKIVLSVAGGLVVLLVAAALVVGMMFDPAALKGEIEQVVKKQTGRTLKIEGDLRLAFYPNIGAAVGKASLSERGGADQFVGLDAAHVSIALLPLLQGQMVVDQLRLEGLRASVVKGKDGKFNFDDLVGGDGKKSDRESDHGGGGAVRFDISGIRIERAGVQYRDLATGQTLELADAHLRTGRIADDVPGEFTLGAKLQGVKPAVSLALDAKGSYRLKFASRAVQLNGLDVRLEGSAAGVSGLTFGLKGDVAAEQASKSLQISNLALELRGARGPETLEAKLAMPKLVLGGAGASSSDVTGSVAVRGGPRTLDAKLVLADVSGSQTAFSIGKLSLQAALEAPELPHKKLTLPVEGTLKVDLEKKTLASRITSKFDQTTLKAELGLSRFAPLAANFDIDIDRIDLDRYLPAGKAEASSPADPKVDLGGLRGIEARGKLHIGALQVKNIKVTEFRSEIRIAGGRAEFGPHSAKLYEGSLAGTITANAQGNAVTAKETLTNVSVGPLVRDVAKRDAIEGRGTVMLDVHTAGPTVGAMKRALAGSARIVLRDGAVKGFDLGQSLRKAKSALGSKSAAEQADASKQTDFSEMTASFAIDKGVARNSDLAAKAPLFRLTGAGDIDIGASKLDYLAKAAIVATSKGQGGADLASLVGLTVPVRVHGPFDAVDYSVDYAALASGLVKNKVTKKVGEALSGAASGAVEGGATVGGAVKDKLKSLFGR